MNISSSFFVSFVSFVVNLNILFAFFADFVVNQSLPPS